MHGFSLKKRYTVLFLVALIAGGAFRFYRLDWGRPAVYHPDEARISYALGDIDRQAASLKAKIARGEDVGIKERIEAFNPHFFAYGSLPLYLIRSSHRFLNSHREALTRILTPLRFLSNGMVDLFVVGRAWSALFDTLTILMIFLLARRIFSRRAACLAALFFAFTVFHIQLSHFLTVDVMLASLIVITVYFCARVMEGGRLRHYGLAGLFGGLAVSTKISAAPIVLPILFAHLAFCWREGRLGSLKQWAKLLAGLSALAAFFVVCEPFFLLDHQEFMRQVREQSRMVTGQWTPPWTLQYAHTSRGFYQLKNLAVYCMGIPLGVTVIAGLIYLLFKWFRKPDRAVFLILAWLVPVAGVTVSFKIKFIRYFAPLIPFLCILGAQGISVLYGDACARGRGFLVRALVFLVLALSLFYCLAYMSIYGSVDSREAAALWIRDYVPRGSCVANEGTYEFCQIRAPGCQRKSIDPYERDGRGKLSALSKALAGSDLIALSTKRMYGSILRVPDRYPLTSNFYRLLFEERLGFKLAKSFTSYPRLFGFHFNDDYADESFTVYDHPKVLLFRKVVDYPPEYVERLLRAEPQISYWPVLDDALGATEFNRPEREGESVTPSLEGYAPKAYGGARAVLLWIVCVEVMGLAALPLTASFFGSLRDRGYPFARVMAIALTGYLVWISASLGIAPFSRGLIVAALVFIMLLSWARSRGGERLAGRFHAREKTAHRVRIRVSRVLLSLPPLPRLQPRRLLERELHGFFFREFTTQNALFPSHRSLDFGSVFKLLLLRPLYRRLVDEADRDSLLDQLQPRLRAHPRTGHQRRLFHRLHAHGKGALGVARRIFRRHCREPRRAGAACRHASRQGSDIPVFRDRSESRRRRRDRHAR